MEGSLETRFWQSTSDYADVLHTRVIDRTRVAANETGLRQLIDDTTAGVLLLKYGDFVLCWLTGIPSSREDYTKTKIRYAIALRDELGDEPGKIQEWAGILCGLYSNQKQLETLGTFLDGFVEENRSINPALKFNEIAAFLKDPSKIEPVQTDGINDDCEFVLASYLAESQDIISSAISNNGMRPLYTGVFWNGGGFSEVKKKVNLLPKLKNFLKEHLSNLQMGTQISSKTLWRSFAISSITVVFALLMGVGVKLISETEDLKNIRLCVKELRTNYNTLQDTSQSLPQAIEAYTNALTDVMEKSKVLNDCASAVVEASKSSPNQEPSSLTPKIASLQQAFKEYNSALKALQGKTDVLKQRAEAVDKESKSSPKRELNSPTPKIALLQQAFKEYNSAFKPFQNKLNDLKKCASAVDKERKSSPKQEPNLLTPKIASLQQAFEEYNSALNALQDKSEELKKCAEAVDQARKNLETRVEDLEKLFPKK